MGYFHWLQFERNESSERKKNYKETNELQIKYEYKAENE